MGISRLVKNYYKHSLSNLGKALVFIVIIGLSLYLLPENLNAGTEGLFSFADLFTYPDAPNLDLQDLYGNQLSLTSYKGKIVIVSFLDKKSQEEATTWVESLPASYLGDSRIVFVNVVFPGGISFLVPRPKVVSRLRQDIEDLRESFRKSLSPKEQLEMESTEIRWAADWKRDWASRWGSIRHMVNVFIIDQDGKLRDTIRGMNDGVQNRLNLVVSRLLDMGK
jgi:cytochrome oxidase Cu insertion factor (SCO1/SenC/PrrC family)